jgi:hypothetical protein
MSETLTIVVASLGSFFGFCFVCSRVVKMIIRDIGSPTKEGHQCSKCNVIREVRVK